MHAAQTYDNLYETYRKSDTEYFDTRKRRSNSKFDTSLFSLIDLDDIKPIIHNSNSCIDTYWIDKFIRFEVLENSYKIPRELSSIKDAIIESLYILSLSDDWDDNDALSTDSITYLRTIDLLIDYSVNVYNQLNHIISPPEINLVRDGSIDLEWRNKQCILLINLKKSSNYEVHFYSEDYKNSTILKGIFDKKNTNPDLIHWMKKI